MDIKEAEKIIHKLGALMVEVSNLEKYPAATYPKSLLPYPIETFEEAAEIYMPFVNEKTKNGIKICLAGLNAFIDDEQANERNNRFKEYKEQKAKKMKEQNE